MGIQDPGLARIQDPGFMGFQDASLNGMPLVGGVQPGSTNHMQPHASNSFQNPIPPVLPPPAQAPFYQPPISCQPGPPLNLTNGSTNTIHYGSSQFFDNSYHPLPSLADSQLASGSLQTTEFPPNRLALHSHNTPFNRYSSATSLDNVTLDKELPDLGQLNSPLFSDASYTQNIAHGLCSPSNDLPNSQSPFTSATNSLKSSFDIDRKRPGCLDVLPNSKQLKLLSGIPTPCSQELDNGLDIFSGQTTPRSSISTSTSTGTPDSFGIPCIGAHAMPDHFSFKPNCDTLDLINAASSSGSSSDNNYWGSFSGFDPTMTSEDLLNDSNIKPFVAGQKEGEQMKQNKFDALDLLTSLTQNKNDSLTSPNTDNQSGSKDDISLKSHSESMVAGSPFQMAKTSESFLVESVLNGESFNPVDDNEVFEYQSDDLPVADDANQSDQHQDHESQQSAQDSTESASDSSPIKVRNSILSSTDGHLFPRSRLYSSQCSDLPTPLSMSSHLSCASPLESSQVNGRISPVTVVIPPDVVNKEYMKCDPLFPPSPPPVNEEIDLHPDVPIIEVCT